MKANMFETLNHSKSEFFAVWQRRQRSQAHQIMGNPNKREEKFCADFVDIIAFNTCEEI